MASESRSPRAAASASGPVSVEGPAVGDDRLVRSAVTASTGAGPLQGGTDLVDPRRGAGGDGRSAASPPPPRTDPGRQQDGGPERPRPPRAVRLRGLLASGDGVGVAGARTHHLAAGGRADGVDPPAGGVVAVDLPEAVGALEVAVLVQERVRPEITTVQERSPVRVWRSTLPSPPSRSSPSPTPRCGSVSGRGMATSEPPPPEPTEPSEPPSRSGPGTSHRGRARSGGRSGGSPRSPTPSTIRPRRTHPGCGPIGPTRSGGATGTGGAPGVGRRPRSLRSGLPCRRATGPAPWPAPGAAPAGRSGSAGAARSRGRRARGRPTGPAR